MANAYNTLADIAALDAGIGFPVIDETVAQYKELSVFPADTMSGTSLELSVLANLPTAGFRNANEGVDRKAAKFETKLFSTAILEQQVAADPKVLSSSKDPARALINITKPHMLAVLQLVAKQIWYGTANDAKGFVGLMSQYAADAQHEIDVAASSAKSSVWMLYLAPENLQLVFGEGQTITQRDWRYETVYDANGKPFDGMTSSISGRVGLRLENKHAALRIKNIGAQTVTNPGNITSRTVTGGLNDDLMYQALQKFEELNRVFPNAIFGTPRSFEQLRVSRLAVSPSGSQVARVDTWEGIPLYRTINLSNAEA